MRVLYFDCFSGISGDMMLGALLDLGIDKIKFKSELDKLKLAGYEIVIDNKVKNGITVTDVQVIVDEEYEKHTKRLMQHQHDFDSHHEHEHHEHHEHTHHEHTDHENEQGHHKHNYHEHNHDTHKHHREHEHTNPMDSTHSETHHHGRNLKDILELINASDLNERTKDFSKKVFTEIARAEAKVHNKKMEEVHFHEVGAVDSIVDIVGVAICLDMLYVERVYSSPLHDGKGFIECQHGLIPVPVPAVMEMLAGSNIPLISEDINTELVTPTGMGLIKCLASSFGDMPAMMIERVGYGAGKRETGRLNALRVVLGTIFSQVGLGEEISILETNIDNMNPEILGFVMEKLLGHGALDVFYTPIYMKKNRPAVMLTVLCTKEKEEVFSDIILRETSTLGIRKSVSGRIIMPREIAQISTEYGDVQVKISTLGDIKKVSPEYEDCKEIAAKTGIPLWKVFDAARKSSGYLLE